MITFYAKNLAGDIHQISYKNFEEIPLLLSESFGYTPLYEPVWISEDGNEKFCPKNKQTVYVLFRYSNIPIDFIVDWCCIEINTRCSYLEYTLLIKSNDIYDEFVRSFFHKTEEDNRFYSEKVRVDILDEDYASSTKYISISDDTPYFTSIKDLFLSFKYDFQNIPDDLFEHMAVCAEKRWRYMKVKKY